MRIMMMLKGDPQPGAVPSEELLAAMGTYNDDLSEAGVLVDASGLHPTADGVRVRVSGDERTVIEGPFSETEQVVAGYWILEVNSMDEATEWATRVASILSNEYGQETEVEVRPVFEPEDFGDGGTRADGG